MLPGRHWGGRAWEAAGTEEAALPVPARLLIRQ